MTPTDKQVAPHAARFMAMLDAAFRRWGAPDGLPPAFRDAVAATPRHRFVHRFRLNDGPLHDAGADPAGHLDAIYSDAVMRHVDAAGDLLPSSNSQPSYILWLLHMLGVQPGHRVLEIGSGSGWLAAVMARLAGTEGRVTGIEIIPALADQSRADLADMGIANVEIVTGDGAYGHPPGAPYDRAIVTAATWELPACLFDQVAEGGRILAPIELSSDDGCDVTVFRRAGAAFVAEQAVPGWFVPLLGSGQDRSSQAFDNRPREDVVSRHSLPLGYAGPGGLAPAAAQFRAFLGRTEPDFVATPSDDAKRGPAATRPVPAFGLAAGDGSLALWQAGEIVAYGTGSAATRLARAYRRWTELGLPGRAAFTLQIHRADTVSTAADQQWVEHRGSTALLWRATDGPEDWQALLQGQ